MTRPLTDRFGYVPPEELTARARHYWPEIKNWPSLEDFEPQTETEIPFWYVPGVPAQELWDMIPIFEYDEKICRPPITMEDLEGDADERGYEKGVPTRVAIDLMRGFEQPTAKFQGEDVATAREVFAAMVMLEVHYGWPEESATQFLGRYNTFDDPYDPGRGHKTVPHLTYYENDLELNLERVDFEFDNAATASVRRW